MGLGIRIFELGVEMDGKLSRLIGFGISILLEFEDEGEVDISGLGKWVLFSMGLGIEFFEIVSDVDGGFYGFI